MDYLNTMVYLAIALSAIYFLASLMRKKDRKLPPGPTGVPFFGNLFGIGTKPHITLTELSKTYGPLMSLQLGQLRSVVISSPDMALEAYKKNDLSIATRFVIDGACALNYHEKSVGWLPVGPKWRNLRKICNSHIFSASKLEATQFIRRKVVKDLVSYIEKSSEHGEVVDIGSAAFTTSLNLLSNTFFSVDLGDPSSKLAIEFREIAQSMIGELGKPNIADCFPLLKKIDPQRIKRRTAIYMRKFIDLFDDLIKQRLEGKRPPGSKQGDDVLDALLDIIQENQDMKLPDIATLLVDMFAGGTDTTATAVEWAVTELLRNPTIMKKAQAELIEIIGKGNPVEESDIARLPYLQAIVKETLRMHPPLPLSAPRKAVSDINLFGFTVPKDTQILLNVWGIGRDPKLWKNPNSFEPERFLGSQIDFRGNDFELLPFGAGRRICPGLPLAARMVHLLLAALIHGFQWKLEGGISPEDMNMDEKFAITLEKAQHLRAIPVHV